MMEDKVSLLLKSLEDKPPSKSLDEAWNLISGALAELCLENKEGVEWKIPEIGARSTQDYGDGGKAFRLIKHFLYINQNGAFRVSKIGEKIEVLFEKEGKEGNSFKEISDYRMPITR
ncbi:MAG: hypothetical protein ABJO52_11110 [Nisaea sp.]|uniref:hypothetical protein n=2 Tax=Pseudomonadota TaxID=1224 RepID=UPI003299CB1C